MSEQRWFVPGRVGEWREEADFKARCTLGLKGRECREGRNTLRAIVTQQHWVNDHKVAAKLVN